MASPLIYRKRLIHAINNPGHHIVYVYGPAGFGKTVLARDWMQSQNLPTAWVEGFSSSNAADLFEVFLKELIRVMPHLASKLDPLLEVENVKAEHIRELVEILEQDKTPFNIVIDNAEEIRRTHNDLSMAIVRHMPNHIKMILVTTTSPRSDFIKEAGITRFAVVGPDELRFSKDEIKQLAQDALPDVDDKEVELIANLTEGWPASTEIVTSLLRNNPEFRNQLSSLSLKGKHQFAIEANRVLAKLDETSRELLKQLAPLQTITPDIAFTLTSNVEVVRLLTLLSQDSIVVTQISQMPPQFKIHPIFRDVLLDDVRREPEFTKQIELVIETLLDHKEVRQATALLIELGETSRLSDILKDQELLAAIGASIQDSIWRSAITELRDWVVVSEYLPVAGKLGKCVINFYIHFLSGEFKQADMQVQILESELMVMNKKVAESWSADLLVLKSLIAYSYGRFEANWEFAMAAFEKKKTNRNEQARHQFTYLHVALWASYASDNDKRVQIISKLLDDNSNVKQPAHRNSAVAAMRCLISAYEGRLIETQNYLITPFTALTNAEVSGYFGPYSTRLAESILAGEQGNLDESTAMLEATAKEAISGFNFPIAIATLGRLAYQCALKRDYEVALSNISRAREMIRIHSLSDEVQSVVDMWEIRVRHFMLDNERVQELLKRCKPSYFVRSFQAAAHIGNGNIDAAMSIIETFNMNVPRQAITFHLFRAHLFRDAPAAQLKEVAKAVECGSKHGYFHHFITQRSDILQQYISLASEFPTAFNERLARAAGEELNKMMIAKNESGDSLTKREADILRHLATGLPLRDIAQNLNISKNTIKTHLRNLYRKLGAVDRTDAVEKGKKLLKV